MDKSEQKAYPKGHFPVRICADSVRDGCSALSLLERFVEAARNKYEMATVTELTGDAHHAEAVISVPFPDREHIRIDFNIFASEVEDEHGDGLYFLMESAF